MHQLVFMVHGVVISLLDAPLQSSFVCSMKISVKCFRISFHFLFFITLSGIAAAVKKLSKIEDWEFFPEWKNHGFGNVRHVRYDWTIMEERPKNYVTTSSKD